ncbi:MAG: ATP synthase subunit b [Verrucomicrobiae bacterium]|nr:ATP synthase subunit b [Verrucomicrobiae bacterium]
MKKAVLYSSLLGLTPFAAMAAEGGVNVTPNNIGLIIWSIATFAVMIILLGKFAFKPIGEALERRGATIKTQLDEAEKSRAEAKKLMEDYQKQIAEARAEAAKVIEEARQLGEKVRKDVVDKANAEASAVVSRAQEEIVRQKEKGIQEMKDTVASLAVQIAGKVIEKEVNEATHKVLVENLIKDLAKVRK